MNTLRRRGPGVLLVFSLVLNASFLAGYWSKRMQAARAEAGGGRDLVADQLELDRDQRAALDAAAAELRPRADRISAQSAALIRQFWEAFAEDPPDRARLESLLAQIEATQSEYRREVLGAAIAFQRNLSPAQRVRFGELLRRHDPAGIRGRPRSSP